MISCDGYEGGIISDVALSTFVIFYKILNTHEEDVEAYEDDQLLLTKGLRTETLLKNCSSFGSISL